MKIEAAEMSEQVATEELVRELVRNDARRGAWRFLDRINKINRIMGNVCNILNLVNPVNPV